MNINEFLIKASDINGYILASLTDEYIVDTWPMTKYSLAGKEDKILEIHIFNNKVEERLIRTDLSKDFIYCEVIDTDRDFFDEYHYIDVDSKRLHLSNNGMTFTTGGGEFNLPLAEKENSKIIIRYYLDRYDGTGHVKLSDWRMVDFVPSERIGN